MTKLSTHIPLRDVKKSEKLRGIKNSTLTGIGGYEVSNLTLADIIDNAESLFGKNILSYGFFLPEYQQTSIDILQMCQQNKPIEEISQYIIDNIN